MKKLRLGIIGNPLGHSFSKVYFDKKFTELGFTDSSFSNYELARIEDLSSLVVDEKDLCGLAVTAPFKQQVIPFLDSIHPLAAEIGSVNCLRFLDGHVSGYNTDVLGFVSSIKKYLKPHQNKALILGTGGASKAAAFEIGRAHV